MKYLVPTQQPTRFVERQPTYQRAYLPYIIHADYKRLVRLCFILQQRIRKQNYGASWDCLRRECEVLYFRIYGQFKFFDGIVPSHLPLDRPF